MRLTIDKEALVKELNDALKTSEGKYQEACVLYLKKLHEYVSYVEKQVRAHRKLTKLAPYFQMWQTQQLIDALAALKLHQGAQVEIDDRELTELKGNIQRLREVAGTTLSTLLSTRY